MRLAGRTIGQAQGLGAASDIGTIAGAADLGISRAIIDAKAAAGAIAAGRTVLALLLLAGTTGTRVPIGDIAIAVCRAIGGAGSSGTQVSRRAGRRCG